MGAAGQHNCILYDTQEYKDYEPLGPGGGGRGTKGLITVVLPTYLPHLLSIIEKKGIRRITTT